MQVRLRNSAPADADALFEIWRRAVAATHHFVSARDLAKFAAVVRDSYLPNAELTVTIDADGKPCGFMGMTDAKIDSLFVDPDVHGQGVGRQLIEHAWQRSPGELDVDVNEQNEGAVGFYRHLGFRTVRRSPVDDTGKPYPLLTMRWTGPKG